MNRRLNDRDHLGLAVCPNNDELKRVKLKLFSFFFVGYLSLAALSHLLGRLFGFEVHLCLAGGFFLACWLAAPGLKAILLLAGLAGESVAQDIFGFRSHGQVVGVFASHLLHGISAEFLISTVWAYELANLNLRQIMNVSVVGTVVFPILGAILGTLSSGTAPSQTYFIDEWTAWWLSDAAGILLAGSLTLAVFHALKRNSSWSAFIREHAQGAGSESKVGSEQKFLSLAAAAPVGIFRTDRAGQNTYVNEWWIRKTGVTSEQAAGEGWQRTIVPADLDRIRNAWRAAACGGEAYEAEFRIKNLTGTGEIWMYCNAVPEFSDGIVIGYIGTVTDITEIKTSQLALADASQTIKRERERLALALQTSRMGVYEWSTIDNRLWWSQEMYPVFGVTPQTFSPSLETFQGLIHQEDLAVFDRFKEMLFGNSQDLVHEFRAIKPDGQICWIYHSAHVTFDAKGSVALVTGAMGDVTAKKATELALIQAKHEAETANQAKSTFLANMSHEIRTPLGAIKGFCELLVSEYKFQGEPMEFLRIILRNADTLHALIDDILDLSRVESGKFRIEKGLISLPALLEEVRSLLSAKAEEKRVELEFKIKPDTPHQVTTDSLRLRQILLNVIGNAVKFTDQGRVDVQISAQSTGPSSVTLEILIKDTGIGIEPSRQKDIFAPFYQADSGMTRRFGGTGLGLALSRRLAHSLGGEIDLVESSVQRGSIFRIRIEVAPASSTQPIATTDSRDSFIPTIPGQSYGNGLEQSCGQSGDQSRVHRLDQRNETSLAQSMPLSQLLNGVSVLVVDDSPDNRKLVQRILERAGATVATANDGLQGIESARARDYAVVLMDLQMPVLDGYEALLKLRTMKHAGPVIALTAHAMAGDREKCLSFGFDSYIAKPIMANELIRVVSEFARASAV